MKGSIFTFFFTIVLVFGLFLSFAAQAKKPIKSKKLNNKPKVPTVISVSPDNAVTEQAILEEMNTARKDPQKYIKYLEEYKKLFKENTVYYPDSTPVVTNEGTAAVDDAINALKSLPKLEAYTLSKGLTQAANLQLKDLMQDSSLGHRGKDGSDLTKRLSNFGSAGSIYAENITYFAKTPREIVLAMLIDDGVKSRSHRKNVLSPNFRQVGFGFGNGSKGESLCVTVFADLFREIGQGGARQF